MGELGQHAAAFLMHRRGEAPVAGNDAVVGVVERIARAQGAGPVDRRRPGDLQGYPAPRLGPVIGDVALARHAVIGNARHMGADQHPVAQGLRPDPKRRQQMGEIRFAHGHVRLRVLTAADNMIGGINSPTFPR